MDERPRRHHGADCDQDKIVAVDEPAPARDYCPDCGNHLPNAEICYRSLHCRGGRLGHLAANFALWLLRSTEPR